MEPGIWLGLGSAASFGAGDFAGGWASRRAPALLVAAGAQAVGLFLLVILLAVGEPGPADARAIGIGAAAGIFGGLGLVALYRGLALGSMGLVTALSGAGSVAIPVLVGAVLLGDTLGGGQWLGVGSAMSAAVLASGATLVGVRGQAIGLAGVAAVGFGFWFVLLDLAAEHGALWALVASRAAAAVLVGGLALWRVRGPRPGISTWTLVAVAGALDVSGNTAFVLGTLTLPAGIVAALAGLYPLVTMLLAWLILRDRLPALGLVAVLLAVVGIVLISTG